MSKVWMTSVRLSVLLFHRYSINKILQLPLPKTHQSIAKLTFASIGTSRASIEPLCQSPYTSIHCCLTASSHPHILSLSSSLYVHRYCPKEKVDSTTQCADHSHTQWLQAKMCVRFSNATDARRIADLSECGTHRSYDSNGILCATSTRTMRICM